MYCVTMATATVLKINLACYDHQVLSALNKRKEEVSTSYSTPPDSIGEHSQVGEGEPTIELREEKYEIHIERTKAGLGLSIAGGRGSTPFKGDDEGIFISRVTEAGPADLAGLRVGDKVISVNSASLVSVSHYDAVEVLKAAGGALVLVVAREVTRLVPPPPPDSACSSLGPSRAPSATSHASVLTSGFESQGKLNGDDVNTNTPNLKKKPEPLNTTIVDDELVLQRVTIHTTLIRDPNGLGFSIAGGKGTAPFKNNSDAIYISRISEGGVAQRDGKLEVGDRVLSINGVDMAVARHDQAVQMLTGLERFVRLAVERELWLPRDALPPTLSGSSPSPSPGLPKPYSYQRPASTTPLPTPTPPTPTPPPQPAPRRLTNTSTSPSSAAASASEPHHKAPSNGTRSTASTDDADDAQEVVLSKASGSLGFSIIGGTDHSSTPFGAGGPGIFVSHVVPGGVAAACTKLRMGDRILKVNGTDVTRATHQEAVMELLRPGDEIRLTVQHDPLPDGYLELTIVKAAGEKLGMHIKGGLRGQKGNPLDTSDEGVFVSKINSGGAARRDGRLHAGMRLLEVNGRSLLGATHQEAVSALRASGDHITLVVCKGYERSDLPPRHSNNITSSVSSLDRDDDDVATTARQEQQMQDELVQFELEDEEERRLHHPITSTSDDLSLSLVEVRPKSTPEKVLDVVRAAEMLVPAELAPPKSPTAAELKTTTIVMSKHTLAPQHTPPQSPKSNAPKMSVSDKLKFFENAMEESHKPSPKSSDKKFSFLSQDEVERMRAEEEKKIASLSRSEIKSWAGLDEADDEFAEEITDTTKGRASTLNIGVVRTAKAERRLKERLREEGLLTDEDDRELSPAEERALRAEKRAAWRQARLKSLEQDAIQAQMVIKSMSDMVATNSTNTTSPETTTDEVETLQEKIISLELTKPEETTVAVNGSGATLTPPPAQDDAEEDEADADDEPPVTPTSPLPPVDATAAANKKKKRKRSKKAKH